MSVTLKAAYISEIPRAQCLAVLQLEKLRDAMPYVGKIL